MKEMSLYELYSIKEKLEEQNDYNSLNYIKLCNEISNIEKLLEDTSGTGGPSVGGGMGAVVSAQPSSLAGSTIGTNWSANGGTVGSGDISVPYPGGGKMQQKVTVMGSNHGPRTGKKSREKKLDLKALKNVFAKRQDFTAGQARSGEKKVMSFDDFKKDDITKIKKD